MLKLNIKYKPNSKAKEEISIKMKRILMKSMFKMEELAIQKAPVDQGYLRQNITLFPEILSNRYVLTSKALYSSAMEFGTRPFYAPIKPLKDWARRKMGDENIGYAVQKKIAQQGIRAHPFMRPAFFQVKDFWVEQYAKSEFSSSI